MGGRDGKSLCKIANGRIELIGSGRIEIAKPDGDRIFKRVTVMQAIR
jgi:hypothetical protein